MDNQNLLLSDLTINKPTNFLNKTAEDSIIYKQPQKSIFEDFFIPSNQKFSFESESNKQETNSFLNLSFESEIEKIPLKEKELKLEKSQKFMKTVDKSSKPEKLEKKIESVGCKCKNSKCLRLHCACFKTLGYCGPSCRCLDCLNKEEFKQARDFVIQKTKIIYKKAFQTKSDKIVNVKNKKIHKEGCNCKKGCNLNYCQCKKFGANCSPICRCESCLNDKIRLSQEEIRKIYKPCSRKKHKIIIKTGKEDKSCLKNIFFESYKKKY